jgi:hypothetical protein
MTLSASTDVAVTVTPGFDCYCISARDVEPGNQCTVLAVTHAQLCKCGLRMLETLISAIRFDCRLGSCVICFLLVLYMEFYFYYYDYCISF